MHDFFKHLKGYGWLLIFAMLLVLLSSLIMLAQPLLIRYAVDELIGGKIVEMKLDLRGILPTIGSVVFAILALSVVRVALFYAQGVLREKAVEGVAIRLRNQLYEKIQLLSFETHNQNLTGELIQKCTSDVDTYLNFFRNQAAEVARLGFMIVSSVIVMLVLSWKLTIISLIGVPLVLWIIVVNVKEMNRLFEVADVAEAKMTAVVQESLSGVRVVKAFSKEWEELQRFCAVNDEVSDSIAKMGSAFARFYAYTDIVMFIQIGATIVVGAAMVVAGELTLGTIMAFLMYHEWLTWPLKQVARSMSQMGKAFVSSKRINSVLNLPSDEDKAVLEPEIEGGIVFDHVSFRYADAVQGGGTALVLDDVSFEMKPGQTLGIIGPTGSGKSTLVYLLQRIYEYEGSIRMDGVELREIRKEWVRKNVGLVMQEPYLFSKTIRENIAITNPHYTEAEVVRAARTASVHSNILAFQDGYETMVGEKGVSLSGGQKQRVAIARTVIDETKKILVFDDSLSAVDAETDAKIRAALSQYSGTHSTIIISHRIDTLKDADLILVLEQGKIVERGTHSNLKDGGGLYERLWKIQTEKMDE